MAEQIETNAVLCALPDDLRFMIRTILKNKDIETTSAYMCTPLLKYEGIETIEAHNREEMLALLQSHTFRGMVTVSSWLPEDEVRTNRIQSIKNIPMIILVESWHTLCVPTRFTSIEGKTNHEWIYLPFDVEEFIVRAMNMGLLPRK
jgi:hypothetical protein